MRRGLWLVAALAACGPGPGREGGEEREISAAVGQVGLYVVDATECTATGCQVWWKALLQLPPPGDNQTTVVERFYRGYDGPRRYFPGPRVDGGGSSAIRDQVLERACADYRAGTTSAAAFVGASRGAVIALDAARRTQANPSCTVDGRALPVSFIGLVDAVDTTIWYMDKRPPKGAATYHRVKAHGWENVYTTVDIPGAVVSVAPETNEQGAKLDHVGVIFHPSSLSWLARTALALGLPVVGPFGVKPGAERRLRTGPCYPAAPNVKGYCYEVARVRVAADGKTCRAPLLAQELAAYPTASCEEQAASGSCTRATVCLPFDSLEQCEDRAPFTPLPAAPCP